MPPKAQRHLHNPVSQTVGDDLRSESSPHPPCRSHPGIPSLHPLSHLQPPGEIQEFFKPKWQQAGNQASPEAVQVPSCPCLGDGATKWRDGARTLYLARLLSPPVLYVSLDVSQVSPSTNHFADSGIFERKKPGPHPSHLGVSL